MIYDKRTPRRHVWDEYSSNNLAPLKRSQEDPVTQAKLGDGGVYASRKFHRGVRGPTSKRTEKETESQNLRAKCFEIAENYKKQTPVKKPLIAIVGPTASGKTDLAIYLAKRVNGQLISADSRQIYRGLDIGTAKDKSFPHHLIDIIDVTQPFSVKEYVDRALPIITQIYQKGRIPIVVGGTGYYVDELLFKSKAVVKPNARLRSKLDTYSSDKLFTMLSQKDRTSAKRIGPTNRKRLIRALEIIYETGKPVMERLHRPTRFNHSIIALAMDRDQLYRQIDSRVEWITSHGLVEETRWLLTKISPNQELAKTIGYEETIKYLSGEFSAVEWVQSIKSHTHRLARKQISWWKRYSEVIWVSSKQEALQRVKKFLSNFEKRDRHDNIGCVADVA